MELAAEIPDGEDETIDFVFEWSQDELDYKDYGTFFHRPLNAAAVYKHRGGVCLEQSVLCASLLLLGGVRASIAHIDVDLNGDHLSHATVLIKRADGTHQLFDSTYGLIDAKHKVWNEKSEKKLIQYYLTRSFLKPNQPKSLLDFLREIF